VPASVPCVFASLSRRSPSTSTPEGAGR
jgi:hypothetical protein